MTPVILRILPPTHKLLRDLAHSKRSSMRAVMEEGLKLISPLELSEQVSPQRAPWFGSLRGKCSKGLLKAAVVSSDSKVLGVLGAAKKRRILQQFLAHEALRRVLRNMGHENLEQFSGTEYHIGSAYNFCNKPAKGIRTAPNGKKLYGVKVPSSALVASVMPGRCKSMYRDEVLRDMILAVSASDVAYIPVRDRAATVSLGVKAQKAVKAKVLELGIPGWKVLECAARLELAKQTK